MNRKLAWYLTASVAVNLGMFIHVLLFNLYLADLGHREDFMGRQAALMTLGIAAGTMPWAALMRRVGLRPAALAAVCGLALSLIARAWMLQGALDAASLLTGLFLAGWFVGNTPAVAAFSAGSLAFSLNISLSIAIGAVGGVLGGQLPGMILHLSPALAAADAKRWALTLAAVPLTLSVAILARLVFPSDAGPQAAQPSSLLRASPARAFLTRFLLAVALWYAFGAGFTPFFNAYLHNRMGATVAAIGGIFAVAHLGHAAATLLMPRLITWLGMSRAVFATQAAAAVFVLAMWPVNSLPVASALYIVYGGFQVMSEPGLHAMLMRGVPAAERPAAMAANLLLMFGVQAAVGAVAGRVIVSHGYGALFVALGITGLTAASLFALLFRGEPAGDRSPPATAAGSGSEPSR